MDLNEMKNKAKELLSDITDARHAREDRSAQEAAGHGTSGPEQPADHGPQRVEALDHSYHAEPVDRHDDVVSAGRVGAPAADGVDQHVDVVDEGHVRAPAPDVPEQRAHPGDVGSHEKSGEAGGAATTGSGATPVAGESERRVQLVPADRAASYRSRWNAVKGDFVDEPRRAVVQADALVGNLLEELEQLFHDQRRSIEHGLDRDETSTEDLRVALRRYRSFFDRLLSL